MQLSLLSLKSGIVYITVVGMLLLGLSVHGDDEPNPEGTPSETATLISSPTDIAIDTPTDVPPTDAPSESPTAEIIPTQTLESSATFPQPTTTMPLRPSPTQPYLPLAYSAPFEPSYPIRLNPHTGWDEIAIMPQGNKALQANAGATPIMYGATFGGSAVEVKFLRSSDEGLVLLRGYAAGVYPNGLVTLYRDQIAVAVANIPPPESSWFTLRLQVIETQVQVSVNGVSLIAITDAAPLPQGYAGFAAQSDAILRTDDFAVYGFPIVAAPTSTAGSPQNVTPVYTSTQINTATKSPPLQTRYSHATSSRCFTNRARCWTRPNPGGLEPSIRSVCRGPGVLCVRLWSIQPLPMRRSSSPRR